MSDQELVKPKRWEGKPLPFKVKYLVANFPEFAITGFITLVVAPLIIAYRCYNFPGSREDALKKYKWRYMVVRDDDPRVPEIMAEKELGREHFPKC